MLARVERSLEKAGADEGAAFGRCEGCSKEIPLERLQLMPYAERCTACQRQLDDAGREPDSTSDRRVDLWMFFEGGKPVPASEQFRPGAAG